MDHIVINEAVDELRTISDFIRFTVSQLNISDVYYGHGTDNAWDEATQLILPSLFLPLQIPQEIFTARLTKSERQLLLELLIKRIDQKIPVPYLTNKAYFCGHEFYVDENVLIPRSPIGELITNHFAGLIGQEPNHILDMCTGSACIAIACAYEFPQTQVDAVDVSLEALNVAEFNIEQHGMLERVTPICSDLFNTLLPIEYDIIVTNPPYVDVEDMTNLPQEYQTEPKMALEAGDDGLDLVRRLLANADQYLSEQGILICEVGNSMTHLMAQYPHVPFQWLHFNNGGQGVFALTKQQLLEHKSIF